MLAMDSRRIRQWNFVAKFTGTGGQNLKLSLLETMEYMELCSRIMTLDLLYMHRVTTCTL